MAVLINIVLAVVTLYFYVVASRRFYRREEPFFGYMGVAILLDVATALTASYRLMPTTQLPGPHRVPWDSVLFITHMGAASLGMFGFIAVFLTDSFSCSSAPEIKLRSRRSGPFAETPGW